MVNKIVVYHLFCIFFISVSDSVSLSVSVGFGINNSISILPSFDVLLNSLYLNSQVLLIVRSHPHPTVRGGVSEWLHGPNCQLLG